MSEVSEGKFVRFVDRLAKVIRWSGVTLGILWFIGISFIYGGFGIPLSQATVRGELVPWIIMWIILAWLPSLISIVVGYALAWIMTGRGS